MKFQSALKTLGDPETLEQCASLKKKLDTLCDSHGLIEEFLQQAGQLSLATQVALTLLLGLTFSVLLVHPIDRKKIMYL